jgi:phosphate:Na+ symporter
MSGLFAIIAGLMGGLGLFLYGMKLMSEGLQKSAGEGLKKVLEKLTANRFVGIGVGTVVTMLIQSSSATTVMIVGFVNAGLLNLPQALSVILGANIGTTMTAQIIAFKLDVIALPAIGVGTAMVMFATRTKVKYIGEIVLGFGLLFFGMTILTGGLAPLQDSDRFKSIFLFFSKAPILAVMAGAFTTIIVQSSSATVAITMALALNGLVDFPCAAALILGENIGTTITANLAAIGSNRTAKQAAFGHFFFNVAGVAYMLILLKPFIWFVDSITPGDPAFAAADGTFPYVARHIANFHTFFNVINMIVFVPLINVVAKLINKVIKTNPDQKFRYTRLAPAMLSTPETALAQLRTEVGAMGGIAMDALTVAREAVILRKSKGGKIVTKYETTLDCYKVELFAFLDLLNLKPLSDKSLSSLESLRITVSSLEEIGDQARKIMKSAEKIIDRKQSISHAANKELIEIFGVVIEFAAVTFQAFSSGRHQTEEEIFLEDRIDDLHKTFRKNHLKRLNKGICSLDAGMNFVDILNALEKVGDFTFSIAQINNYHK